MHKKEWYQRKINLYSKWIEEDREQLEKLYKREQHLYEVETEALNKGISRDFVWEELDKISEEKKRLKMEIREYEKIKNRYEEILKAMRTNGLKAAWKANHNRKILRKKRKVCRRAHELRKQGYDMGTAMMIAWLEEA